MKLSLLIASLCLLCGLNGHTQEVPVLINPRLFLPFKGINNEIAGKITKHDVILVRKFVKKNPAFINDTLMNNLRMVKISHNDSRAIDAITSLQFDIIPVISDDLFSTYIQSFFEKTSHRSLTYKRICMFKNKWEEKQTYFEFLPQFINEISGVERKKLIREFDQLLQAEHATREDKWKLWCLGKALSIIGNQKAINYVVKSIELTPDKQLKIRLFQQLEGLRTKYLTDYFIDRFFELSLDSIAELNENIEFNSLFSLLLTTVKEFKNLYDVNSQVQNKIELRKKLEKKNYHFLKQIN